MANVSEQAAGFRVKLIGINQSLADARNEKGADAGKKLGGQGAEGPGGLELATADEDSPCCCPAPLRGSQMARTCARNDLGFEEDVQRGRELGGRVVLQRPHAEVVELQVVLRCISMAVEDIKRAP